MFPGCQQENEEAGATHCLSFCSALHEGAVNTHMPKPKKPRRRKDTLLYMSALQMMEGLAGATHAAAQQYQLFPASVAATNLQVQHNAVLANNGDRRHLIFNVLSFIE